MNLITRCDLVAGGSLLKIMFQALLPVLLLMPFTVTAASKDNPLLAMLVLEQLEQRAVDGVDPEVLEGAGWLGYDLDKLWLDFEMQRADGQTQVSEWQLRYSRAILPYWDWQLGLRRDFEPGPRRNWLAIGLNGLAPYWFEVDISLFLGRSGRSALRAEAEYELMLTQRWALVPEIEVNAHAHNDMKTGVGSGLSEIEAGLRLRYEVRREFAPYIGINWEKAYGNTKRFEREAGERSEEGALVFGLRAWF